MAFASLPAVEILIESSSRSAIPGGLSLSRRPSRFNCFFLHYLVRNKSCRFIPKPENVTRVKEVEVQLDYVTSGTTDRRVGPSKTEELLYNFLKIFSWVKLLKLFYLLINYIGKLNFYLTNTRNTYVQLCLDGRHVTIVTSVTTRTRQSDATFGGTQKSNQGRRGRWCCGLHCLEVSMLLCTPCKALPTYNNDAKRNSTKRKANVLGHLGAPGEKAFFIATGTDALVAQVSKTNSNIEPRRKFHYWRPTTRFFPERIGEFLPPPPTVTTAKPSTDTDRSGRCPYRFWGCGLRVLTAV